MSYSQFSFAGVVEQFNLTVTERAGLFQDAPALEISDYLRETLNFNVPVALAVNSEKARSEFIIAPVMLELKKLTNYALFSGVEFNVDESTGLNGYVDFLISQDPEQIFVLAPGVVVIEAKRDDLASGLGQCAATLVGAQQFNQRRSLEDIELVGAVTTGTVWRFLKLKSDNLHARSRRVQHSLLSTKSWESCGLEDEESVEGHMSRVPPELSSHQGRYKAFSWEPTTADGQSPTIHYGFV